MKLVIDIPEHFYENNIKKDLPIYLTEDNIVAILPKGHGKIVDIGKVIDSKCNECGHIRGVTCTIPCYEVRRMLSDAPTIVEADTAESEEATHES